MATASPGCFFHCSNVASATDSDSCGTLTSTMDMFLLVGRFLLSFSVTKPVTW